MNKYITVFTVLIFSVIFHDSVSPSHERSGDTSMEHRQRDQHGYNTCCPYYDYPNKTGSLLEERFYWRTLDYAYPSEADRQTALAQGDYVPKNNIPAGIEIWKNKMLIAVPRLAEGVPSTLNYLPLDEAPVEEPKLIPYPDWEANREGDCNALTTIYRMRVDKCDRLWVLDAGKVGSDDTNRQLCPFAINVYDLHTDQRIRKYQLKSNDTKAKSIVFTLAVDIGDTCEDTFMYAADEIEPGLIVYSWKDNNSWRVESNYFNPDPHAGCFNIDGITFQWNDGMFGLALSPLQSDGYKTLYFHPISSYDEFSVSTSVLRNETKKGNNYCDFTFLSSRGPGGHVTSQYMNSDGILLFNLVDQNAVGCWNSSKPYVKKNLDVVARDDVRLIFPSDVVIDRNNTAWVLSDKLSTYSESSLNYSDFNFRILFAHINTLIEGTVCD